MANRAANTATALAAVPGVAVARDPATRGSTLQQTMLRVRDPRCAAAPPPPPRSARSLTPAPARRSASLDFYTRVLGMTLLAKWDFPDMAFSLYFLNFVDDPAALPSDPAARARAMMAMPGCVELTHNYGTEDDAAFAYSNGNEEPCKGFGHIGVTVPNVAAACARFEALGVEFVKRPDAGKMRNLAFIKDPDGENSQRLP